MNGRSLKQTGALMALALVLAAAVPGRAETVRRGPIRMAEPADIFTASGELSGTLDPDFPVNGVMYHLSPDALIYEIGRGIIPPGSFIGDRMVFVAGPATGNTVTTVIVRPSGESVSRTAVPDGSVQTRSASEPL
ncbi:MAG TPA: hypothetical protein VMI75_33255 [Polyangiaceae bacterium]|nr:hypothetical protein [Polyangiaceae bacterium]